uniref:Uncharacterized protein n=1 Tax=Amazona collaria TaxID=241587 RepID=A0A8B9FGB1_9PSIT
LEPELEPEPCVTAAMAARASHWHSSLGAIMPHERQRLEHFQQAEDILLTLLEDVHFRKPCFLVDYARNLESPCGLAVMPCWCWRTGLGTPQPGTVWDWTPAISGSVLGTDSEDWTSAVCVMEQEGGEGCLVPVKVLQHLKELVLAIMCCQYCFLLQPGVEASGSTENLQEGAMVLSLLIHDGCKAIRFDIVPVKRWQELLQLKGQQSDGLLSIPMLQPPRFLFSRGGYGRKIQDGACLRPCGWLGGIPMHSGHCRYPLPSWEDTGLPVSLARSSTAHTDSWQADLSPRALLQLLTEDRSCSDTACFDILLSQEMPDPQLVLQRRVWQCQKPPGSGSLGCAGVCPQPLACATHPHWRLWEDGDARAWGSRRAGSPLLSLPACLCLVPDVQDPGWCTPLRNVPAPLQDPVINPSAELRGILLPLHLGVSELGGGGG